jgi:hypothetical protein
MTTLSATYCAFCEIVSKGFDNFIIFFEHVGRCRAAAELTRQGYYAEAKKLMLEINNRDPK